MNFADVVRLLAPRVDPLIWFYAVGLFILAFVYLWCMLCYVDDP